LLAWEIAYSDVAGSGDFGFNSGPWTYRAKKTDENPGAYGEFNSVWIKQANGAWKNVLDIGIVHGEHEGATTWKSSKVSSSRSTNPSPSAARDAEKTWATGGQYSKEAYRKALSSEVRLMVSGSQPFVGPGKLDAYLAACPPQSNYIVLGSESASSGDMGYVYGSVDVVVSKDGISETKKATFVRIWKHESTGWKIVLNVLSF
jgi:ketosteroid isomerase-like protein